MFGWLFIFYSSGSIVGGLICGGIAIVIAFFLLFYYLRKISKVNPQLSNHQFISNVKVMPL